MSRHKFHIFACSYHSVGELDRTHPPFALAAIPIPALRNLCTGVFAFSSARILCFGLEGVKGYLREDRLLGEAWASVGVLLGRVLGFSDLRFRFSIDKLIVLCYTGVSWR